ncbi:MAG: M23 family metallopeptidase [Candidatus Marinimicrobia bacterium]|nr:M23 family metallopeptidase [Candidatus Neomarinimicrobiota bacterium]
MMHPSRYTFLIIPDHDGENKRFSISRTRTLVILITVISIFSGMVFALIYLTPKALDQKQMKNRYDEVIGERTKVLKLYRDLERMKQMELVVQKALGTDLKVSESGEGNLVETKDLKSGLPGDAKNIPSLIPVKGYLTQAMMENKESAIRQHYGVDIAVPAGEPVAASAGGQVVFAGWTPELGNLVVIYHGNEYFTYYGHNELLLADPHQKVSGGDIIATSGNSGMSSGPHLHFEIWKDGEAVDPLSYFPELKQSNMSVD